MTTQPSKDTFAGAIALFCALTVFVAAALDPPGDLPADPARHPATAAAPAH